MYILTTHWEFDEPEVRKGEVFTTRELAEVVAIEQSVLLCGEEVAVSPVKVTSEPSKALLERLREIAKDDTVKDVEKVREFLKKHT